MKPGTVVSLDDSQTAKLSVADDLPGDEHISKLNQRAQAAERVQDWNAAVYLWSDLHNIIPDARAPLVGLANALIHLRRTDEAEAALQKAPKEFYNHLDFLVAMALSADVRGDQDSALLRWSNINHRFADFSYAHAAIAAIYLSRGEYEAAEAVIGPALARFPLDADILVHATNTAIARKDWENADLRLRPLLATLPDHPYVAARGGQLRELVANGLGIANSDSLWRDVEAAERRGDWSYAHEIWTKIHERGTAPRDSYIGLARSARELGNFSDAEAHLAKARAAYPDDAEVFANYAQIASNAQDWEEAARRWREGIKRFPELDVCCNLSAEALRRIGAFDEADQLAGDTLQKYPERMDIRVLHAIIAQDAGRWDDAVARWEAIAQIMPDDPVVRDARGRAIWHAGLQDPEHRTQLRAPVTPTAADVSIADAESERLKQLMLAFEGLGDNCEFGMVQRHFGAEPLGLLRFSGIRPQQVAELLSEEFERLGDPDHTRLHEAADGSFMVEDDRGYYHMHTFLKKDDIEPGKLLAQQIKRINFLKRELMEDLRSGEKILVCKQTDQRISDTMLLTLSERLGIYGKNILVGIRLADQQHPAGSVDHLTEDILVGYVAAMYTQEPSTHKMIDFVSWKNILETAYRHRKSRLK
jgi:tetratricopeptide (TPR) repeat protein